MNYKGYVLGVDKTKMYSIIIDEKENKTYQMDCELKLINTKEIVAEQSFILNLDEEGNMSFEFLEKAQ